MGPVLVPLFLVLVALGGATFMILFAPSRADRTAIRESGYSLREIRQIMEQKAIADRLLAEVLGNDRSYPQLDPPLRERVEKYLDDVPRQIRQ